MGGGDPFDFSTKQDVALVLAGDALASFAGFVRDGLRALASERSGRRAARERVQALEAENAALRASLDGAAGKGPRKGGKR